MADPLTPRDVANAGLCIGCGACGAGQGPLGWDRFGQLKPAAQWADAPVAGFDHFCPFSPAARDEDAIAADRFSTPAQRDKRIGSFEAAYVGHVAEGAYRAGGSSGGMVSWVAAELLRRGLIDGVAHVVPVDPGEGRFFRYRISRSVDQIMEGARSRYYPVELSRIFDEIRTVPGRYAIVGVPCFIKATNLLREVDSVIAARVAFTLGLFCGHMKSARLVESFAWQLGVEIDQVHAIEYRRKNPDRPASWYTAHLTLADGSARWQDWMHLADGEWGAGFFQNNACNYCDDVTAETADIAFGDAWVEPYSSDGRGTNVVIVRSPQMLAIVAEAREKLLLALDPVDADFVAQTQAAGLRQRREGLAYRLRIAPPALPLRKRVSPGGESLPLRRKLIYRTRRVISASSHRMFLAARLIHRPLLYLSWARTTLSIYSSIAYLRGGLGRLIGRFIDHDS